MAKSIRASIKFKLYKRVRKALTERYPDAFPVCGRRPPLKIGILKDILPVDDPEISATQVRIFLNVWTSSTAYLQSVSRGGQRVCTQGNKIETVSPMHAAEARKILNERAERRSKLVDTRK
jgi:sRNA-binding protein